MEQAEHELAYTYHGEDHRMMFTGPVPKVGELVHIRAPDDPAKLLTLVVRRVRWSVLGRKPTSCAVVEAMVGKHGG